VRLEVSDRLVRLTVEDDGRGIPAGTSTVHPSLGMVGMRARAREVNGEIKVENRADGGLRIRVEAPVAGPQDGIEQEDPDPVG
jgi:signal transduction histidine kinase